MPCEYKGGKTVPLRTWLSKDRLFTLLSPWQYTVNPVEGLKLQRHSHLLHTLSVGGWSDGISILNACTSLARASDMFEAILSRLGLVPPLITESWLQPEIVSRSASCGPVLDLLDGLALLLVDCAPCGLRPGYINVCSCIPNEHRVNQRNKDSRV